MLPTKPRSKEDLLSVLSPQHESVVVRSARILYIDHQCHQLGVIEMHLPIPRGITMHTYLSARMIYGDLLRHSIASNQTDVVALSGSSKGWSSPIQADGNYVGARAPAVPAGENSGEPVLENRTSRSPLLRKTYWFQKEISADSQ